MYGICGGRPTLCTPSASVKNIRYQFIFKPRLHQGNMLPGNMLPWCKRDFSSNVNLYYVENVISPSQLLKILLTTMSDVTVFLRGVLTNLLGDQTSSVQKVIENV